MKVLSLHPSRLSGQLELSIETPADLLDLRRAPRYSYSRMHTRPGGPAVPRNTSA